MRLEILTKNRLSQFKADIKAAFRYGAAEGMGTDEEVLPEEDLMLHVHLDLLMRKRNV